jgi:hypothetical protein
VDAFEDVLARAFRADNGELAVMPGDAGAYLDACEKIGADVLGWDVWLVDHTFDDKGALTPRKGAWCGMLPALRATTPVVIGGEGDAEETRAQISALDLDAIVAPQWRPFLRINVALDVEDDDEA